jgi:hypothetical protein
MANSNTQTSLSKKEAIKLASYKQQVNYGRKLIFASASFILIIGLIASLIDPEMHEPYIYLTYLFVAIYGLMGILSYKAPMLAFGIAFLMLLGIIINNLLFSYFLYLFGLIIVSFLAIFILFAFNSARRAFRLQQKVKG